MEKIEKKVVSLLTVVDGRELISFTDPNFLLRRQMEIVFDRSIEDALAQGLNGGVEIKVTITETDENHFPIVRDPVDKLKRELKAARYTLKITEELYHEALEEISRREEISKMDKEEKNAVHTWWKRYKKMKQVAKDLLAHVDYLMENGRSGGNDVADDIAETRIDARKTIAEEWKR